MQEQGNFKRELNLLDATSIVAGSMVGSGIFIVSADIARQVQNAWLLLAVWLVSALITTMAALCYGEYAAAMPEAGGQYVYLKKVWGKLVGFLYGWVLFLVIQTGTVAAVAVAFAKFLSVLFPQVSSEHVVLSVLGFDISQIQAIAIGLVVLLTYINTRGVKLGAIVQNLFTSTKMIALVGLVLCGLLFGVNQDVLASNFSFSSIPSDLSVFSIIAVAMVGALFSSDAWFNVTFIASEIKKPEKNLPRSLFLGVGGVCLIYFLINLMYMSTLSLEAVQMAQSDIVGATFFDAIFGNIGKIIISIVILISAFGCANGILLSGARVYWAMARDGLFFEKLGVISPKTNVPVNALVVQGVWTCLLVLSGSYSDLLDYVIFTALLFYIMTIGGLFLFRKKFPDMERPYKTVFYPYLPAFYCLLAGFIAINLVIYKPAYTVPGLLLLLAGIPVYYLKGKKV